MTTLIRIAAAGLVAAFASAAALAQDARSILDPLRQEFAAAVVAGDADPVAAMFAEEPTYLPITGETLESRDAIAAYYREGPDWESFTITPSKTEQVGDVIVETGTFEGAAGEVTTAGEYLAVAVEEGGGYKIKTVAGFAKRGAPQ